MAALGSAEVDQTLHPDSVKPIRLDQVEEGRLGPVWMSSKTTTRGRCLAVFARSAPRVESRITVEYCSGQVNEILATEHRARDRLSTAG